MPEYLAPGVFVEETSFRSKIIEGVSTTTTGFVGPCRFGPVQAPPDIITSIGEFERTYAGGDMLNFAGDALSPTDTKPTTNFLWHAARAFFSEGGKRLYISRIFRSLKVSADGAENMNQADPTVPLYADGCARPTTQVTGLIFRARFPGLASNLIVQVQARAAQNILGAHVVPQTSASPVPPTYAPKFGALHDRDIVYVSQALSPFADGIYLATYDNNSKEWSFEDDQGITLHERDLNPSPAPGAGTSIYPLTVSIGVLSSDREHDLGTWAGLPPDPAHEIGGEADSLCAAFSLNPASIGDARSLPLVIDLDPTAHTTPTGLKILSTLFPHSSLLDFSADDQQAFGTLAAKLAKGVTTEIILTGGNDGLRPGAAEYEGTDDESASFKTGLKQFEDLDDISIVAAPGCTADYNHNRDDANATIGELITHATQMRYRIAVLDCADNQSIADVRRLRAKLDSTYAAFYYPWVTILDPITRRELNLPPSGFVAGIYARNDTNRAVYKAPANEVVNLAIGFEQILNKGQQEVLNPEGINCFRFFEGRGYRLWGARTVSSDNEWKYVNLRRYFAYLEHSIDKGTQWAVFEPNGEQLWANVRRTISDFLLNEFQSGALLGDKPEQAYFVKCDRTTMTQNDLDNGRLICLIGVAALRPAEFVIFRIGQWTADHKV